jgi:hypothetical protein
MSAAFNSLDPFRSNDFRSRFDRLCLLPLQISNAFSFDAMVNYRTQFEYLYDFLAAAPKDVGVIVTEHPQGEPVLRRSGPFSNIDTLGRTFPNTIFLDEFRRYQSPAQFLVPRVDGVWSVSSSVPIRPYCLTAFSALHLQRNYRTLPMQRHSRIFLVGLGIASRRTSTHFWRGCSSVTLCRRRCLPMAAGSATISSVGWIPRARLSTRSMRSYQLLTRIASWTHGPLKRRRQKR